MEHILARYRITEIHSDEYYNDQMPAINRLHVLKDLLDYYKIDKNWTALEIGSYAGASAELIAQYVKEITCCDIWEEFIKPQQRAQIVYQDFLKTKKRNPNIIERKINSNILANETPNHTYHLIYIDADHDYQSVKNDIIAWKEKVKPGGIISGHDYHSGVKQAVDEIYGEKNVKTFKDSSWAYKIPQ